MTSLYAVIKGKEVVRANIKRERIRIAFNPLEARFDVADASIVKDKSYIPDISVFWRPDASLFDLAASFITELQAVRAAPLGAKVSAAERKTMLHWHALPPAWWSLPYEEFLLERRARMARVAKEAYGQLCGSLPVVAAPLSVAELLAGGEGGTVEFKSTLRTNLHTGQHDEKMHLAVLKSVTGFMNAKGGTLVVGVSDDGKVLGLGADGFQNEDKMALHLGNLVRDRIGELFAPYVHAHFQEQDEGRVFVVRCDQGPKPALVRNGTAQRFFVRGGNATTELVGSAVMDYAAARFS